MARSYHFDSKTIKMNKLWWWGYIDLQWEINLRSYFMYDTVQRRDIDMAKASEFAIKVVEPFVADSKESAMRILEIERLILEGEKKGQGGGWNMDS